MTSKGAGAYSHSAGSSVITHHGGQAPSRPRSAPGPPSYVGKCPCREHCCFYPRNSSSRNQNKVTATTSISYVARVRLFQRQSQWIHCVSSVSFSCCAGPAMQLLGSLSTDRIEPSSFFCALPVRSLRLHSSCTTTELLDIIMHAF